LGRFEPRLFDAPVGNARLAVEAIERLAAVFIEDSTVMSSMAAYKLRQY
jgi:hypothetical protein